MIRRIEACAIFIIFLSSFINCRKYTIDNNRYFKVASVDKDILGISVIQLINGRYIAACIEPNNNNRGLLFNIDENGNVLNRRELPDSSFIFSIVATPDGGFTTSGKSLMHFSSTCNLIWDARKVWDSFFNINNLIVIDTQLIELPDYVNPILASSSNSNVYSFLTIRIKFGKYSHIMLSINDRGGLLHIDTIKGLPDTLMFLPLKMVCNENCYFIIGADNYYSALKRKFPYFFMKIDATFLAKYMYLSNVSNTATYGSVGEDFYINNANELIIAGDTTSYANLSYLWNRGVNFVNDAGNIFCEKVDINTGEIKQYITYKTRDTTAIPYINKTMDGGSIIAATNNFNRTNTYKVPHIILMKIDQNLDTVWTKVLNLQYPARPFGVFQTNEGGYLVFVNIQSFNQNYNDFAVIKFDAHGNIAN